MKKYIIFIVLCLLVTGCTTTSNVKMNTDGSVLEEVKVLDNNSKFSSSNKTKSEVIESSISNYKAALDFRKYSYDIIVGKEQSGGKFYKKYDNICSYFEYTLFNQYVFPHIKCEEDDNYYTIYNDTNYISYCSDCSDWPILDKVTLNIELPIKANEHNADNVKDTTYEWNFDKNTNSEKSFYLKINKNVLEENYKKTLEKNEIFDKTKIIIVILIVVVTFSIISYILYKKYKANKLEY